LSKENSTNFTAQFVSSSKDSSKIRTKPSVTRQSQIAELGENIVIRRFVRYLVGEPCQRSLEGVVAAFVQTPRV